MYLWFIFVLDVSSCCIAIFKKPFLWNLCTSVRLLFYCVYCRKAIVAIIIYLGESVTSCNIITTQKTQKDIRIDTYFTVIRCITTPVYVLQYLVSVIITTIITYFHIYKWTNDL